MSSCRGMWLMRLLFIFHHTRQLDRNVIMRIWSTFHHVRQGLIFCSCRNREQTAPWTGFSDRSTQSWGIWMLRLSDQVASRKMHPNPDLPQVVLSFSQPRKARRNQCTHLLRHQKFLTALARLLYNSNRDLAVYELHFLVISHPIILVSHILYYKITKNHINSIQQESF